MVWVLWRLNIHTFQIASIHYVFRTFSQNGITAKNIVISPNFLVWKFCGKAQFRHSFGFRVNRPKLCRNCAFPQNFRLRKLGQITVFFTVSIPHNCCHHLVFSICLATQLWGKKGGKVVLKMFQFSLTHFNCKKCFFAPNIY